jgi:hypothetical protein
VTQLFYVVNKVFSRHCLSFPYGCIRIVRREENAYILSVLLDAGYNHVLSHFSPLLAPGIRTICPSHLPLCSKMKCHCSGNLRVNTDPQESVSSPACSTGRLPEPV